MKIELQSIGDDAPSGPNLEYESVFTALEMAAQPGEERQAGNEIIEADPPNYSDVINKASAVLEQSHDLRAAVHLARAALQINGFPGLADATTYMRGCLETYWDTCHPQLDADDDNDPTMRVNAVLGLSDGDMVKAVRKAPMTRSNAFGTISLRDIDIASGEVMPSHDDDRVPDSASISAAFRDTSEDVLKEIFEAARTALEDLKAIDAAYDGRIPGLGPDLSPIEKVLQRVVTRLAEETGGDTETPESDPEGAVPEQAPAAVAATPAASGKITTTREVEAALERVLRYYADYEPSSPLPLLLNRAKRLVGADFMTIVKDIAPGGIDNVMLLGGLADEE